MRLWHKDLVDVLPRQQLIAQWRECCCIAKNVTTKGTPNHLLVNPIMNYSINDFVNYTSMVYREAHWRGYRVDWCKFIQYFPLLCQSGFWTTKDLYKDWHNDRYLYQCYFNLQEKFDRGGISEDEFNLIKNKIQTLIESGEVKCLSLTI